MHLQVTGSAPTYTIGAGTPLRSATGDPVPTLGPPTGSLLNPASFTPAKLGSANEDIQLTASTQVALGIDNIAGGHETGDYTAVPHLGSSRYAKVTVGDTLLLSVTNTTSAHHPFHLHGFSMQPISLTPSATAPPSSPSYTWPYREFRDNIDVPAKYVLTFRIKIEERPLPDGTTLGGALGRWVFHCHIFFHHTNGMISEVVVTAPNGNERPDVNADLTKVAVTQIQTATMTGTYADPDGDPVTLTASRGAVVNNNNGTWSWSQAIAPADTSGFAYITATDPGGLKNQAVFFVDVSAVPISNGPTLTLTPLTDTNPVFTSHTVTATLSGVPAVGGQKLLFTVAGTHARTGSATTTAAGTATFGYGGTAVGSDTITACYDANANGTCEASELKTTVKKTWIFRPPTGIGHFKCYVVTPTTTSSRRIVLTDQFGKRSSTAGKRQLLCNPASKNGGRIMNATAHLLCYATTDRGAAFKTRQVRVANQFGTKLVTVVKPTSLCVPSLKRRSRVRPPSGANPSLKLDHFRCYAVKEQPSPRTVTVRDQFRKRTTKVVRLTTLCNPVRKVRRGAVSKIRRPAAHLVCYSITEPLTVAQRVGGPIRVVVRNQFERRARLTARRAHSLCLPSLKQDLPIARPG
jgi:hypothetical protein